MKFPILALLAAAALTAGSCTKRPVRPQFTVVSTDSLISGNGFSCDFEYRFASIANAQNSPALAAIERMNIDRFFDLENFEGTPEEAASAAIRQVTSDMTPPGNTPESTVRPAWEGEISVESEGSVVDTLLCYVITRASYTGGAHGIYGTECYNYSLAGGYEITTADLFTETQLERLNRLIREDIYEQYGVRSDEELETKGFFPGIHRCNGEFPRHARRHHVLLQSLRHRMLRARERRGEREPRTAGRTLTVRPCKEKKKGPSLTTRTFFFGGEPPPPKMRFNRRYSTAERVPPLWS